MAFTPKATKQEFDFNIFLSSALRRYVHCSKKMYRGMKLTNDESADFFSSKLLAPMWEELVPNTAANLKLIGYDEAKFDPEQGWVRLKVNGRHLYYPFTLAMHPPPVDVLQGLAEAADRYRMFEDSLICLSGSAPLGGVVSTIGDLDLFEYVLPDNVKSALRQKDPKYRDDNVVCLKAKIAQTDAIWPEVFEYTKRSDEIHHDKIRRYSAKYLDNFNFCKIDMVGEFGPLWGEITNIIYKSDSINANDAFPTHTFQEITVDREPFENSGSLKNFGKYCYFLRDEIEKIGEKLADAEQNPDTKHAVANADNFLAVKGAKRAINLCSVLQIDYFDFADIANSQVGKRYVAIQLLDALRDVFGNASTAANAKSANTVFTKILSELDENTDDAEQFDIRTISSLLLGLVCEMDALCFPNSQPVLGEIHEES